MSKNGKHPYGKTVDPDKAIEKKKTLIEVLVNADQNPALPVGLKYGRHMQMGQWKLVTKDGELYANGKKVVLIPCDDKNGVMLSAETMTQKLRDMGLRPLNANFRDSLIENPTFIPEHWHGKSVFFKETTFTAPNGDPCVPFFYEIGKKEWFPHNLQVSKEAKDTFFGKKANIACI